MLLAIFAYRIANCRWRVVLRAGDCGEQAQCSREHCPSILFQHGCNDKAASRERDAAYFFLPFFLAGAAFLGAAFFGAGFLAAGFEAFAGVAFAGAAFFVGAGAAFCFAAGAA